MGLIEAARQPRYGKAVEAPEDILRARRRQDLGCDDRRPRVRQHTVIQPAFDLLIEVAHAPRVAYGLGLVVRALGTVGECRQDLVMAPREL